MINNTSKHTHITCSHSYTCTQMLTSSSVENSPGAQGAAEDTAAVLTVGFFLAAAAFICQPIGVSFTHKSKRLIVLTFTGPLPAPSLLNSMRMGSLLVPLIHSSAVRAGSSEGHAGKMSPWNISDCTQKNTCEMLGLRGDSDHPNLPRNCY